MSHDPVTAPSHYTVYPVQPIAITRHLGFCLGNAVKYVLRAPHKGGAEDLHKALQYLTWEYEMPFKPCFGDYDAMCDAVDDVVSFIRKDLPYGRVSEGQAFFLTFLKSYALGIWREEGPDYRESLRARDAMRRVILEMLAAMGTQP